MEAAYIDMIVETLQDMFKNMPFMEKDPEVKVRYIYTFNKILSFDTVL